MFVKPLSETEMELKTPHILFKWNEMHISTQRIFFEKLPPDIRAVTLVLYVCYVSSLLLYSGNKNKHDFISVYKDECARNIGLGD